MLEAAAATAAIIRKQIPEAPEVALVLGSGLGAVAGAVKQPVSLRYADLPGFPKPTVAGHGGSLVLGRLAGRPVAVMQGRAHYYEQGRDGAMKLAPASLQALGFQRIVLGNPCGSSRQGAGLGRLLLLSAHTQYRRSAPLF